MNKPSWDLLKDRGERYIPADRSDIRILFEAERRRQRDMRVINELRIRAKEKQS